MFYFISERKQKAIFCQCSKLIHDFEEHESKMYSTLTHFNSELLKFICSEKATKFCEIFALLLSYAQSKYPVLH